MNSYEISIETLQPTNINTTKPSKILVIKKAPTQSKVLVQQEQVNSGTTSTMISVFEIGPDDEESTANTSSHSQMPELKDGPTEEELASWNDPNAPTEEQTQPQFDWSTIDLEADLEAEEQAEKEKLIQEQISELKYHIEKAALATQNGETDMELTPMAGKVIERLSFEYNLAKHETDPILQQQIFGGMQFVARMILYELKDGPERCDGNMEEQWAIEAEKRQVEDGYNGIPDRTRMGGVSQFGADYDINRLNIERTGW